MDPLEGRAVVVVRRWVCRRRRARSPASRRDAHGDRGRLRLRPRPRARRRTSISSSAISTRSRRARSKRRRPPGIPIELHPRRRTRPTSRSRSSTPATSARPSVTVHRRGRRTARPPAHRRCSRSPIPSSRASQIEAWIGDAWVRPLHGPGRAVVRRRVQVRSSRSPPSAASRTACAPRGSTYPLRGETLFPGSTRGVSNELEGTEAEVSLEEGTLLIVQPDALS